MDECMVEQRMYKVHAWMNEWMNERMVKTRNICIWKLMNEWTRGWLKQGIFMNECMNVWIV